LERDKKREGTKTDLIKGVIDETTQRKEAENSTDEDSW